MEQWDVKLAQIFKARDNPNIPGAGLAKVITGMPRLTLSLGEEIVLDRDDLVIANRMYHLPTPLTSGSYVIIVPSSDGQTHFVLDKAGE